MRLPSQACPAPSFSSSPSPGAAQYLERSLRDDGFEVLGATRNREALDLVERARPDLVVATGLELCRRLREGEPGRTLGPKRPGDRGHQREPGSRRPRARPRARRRRRRSSDPLPTWSWWRGSARSCGGRRRPATSGSRPATSSSTAARGGCSCAGRRSTSRAASSSSPRGSPPTRTRVDEGRAAARRLGLPVGRRHAHRRLARVPSARQAPARRDGHIRGQRLGRGLPATRVSPIQNLTKTACRTTFRVDASWR